jgi:imidazolonepropionase-like amidohydrolase
MTGFEGDQEQAIAGYQAAMHDRLKRAIAHSVQIVAGSDMYINLEMPQGEGAKEVLVSYLEAGMKPLDILQSATYHSAKFMEKEQSIGLLQEGAFADIIAVEGDIEADFAATIFNVVFVMKDGKRYLEKY